MQLEIAKTDHLLDSTSTLSNLAAARACGPSTARRTAYESDVSLLAPA